MWGSDKQQQHQPGRRKLIQQQSQVLSIPSYTKPISAFLFFAMSAVVVVLSWHYVDDLVSAILSPCVCCRSQAIQLLTSLLFYYLTSVASIAIFDLNFDFIGATLRNSTVATTICHYTDFLELCSLQKNSVAPQHICKLKK